MSDTTTIEEILESELKSQLRAAQATIQILESFYNLHGEKTKMIPLRDIPNYDHLRAAAFRTNYLVVE